MGGVLVLFRRGGRRERKVDQSVLIDLRCWRRLPGGLLGTRQGRVSFPSFHYRSAPSAPSPDGVTGRDRAGIATNAIQTPDLDPVCRFDVR